MFGRKSNLPDGWEAITRSIVPNWDAFSDDDRNAFIAALEWAFYDIAWEPAAGFALDDTMRVTLAVPVALMTMALDTNALDAATQFIVWPDETPPTPELPLVEMRNLIPLFPAGGSLFPIRNDPYTVPLPLSLSWAEVRTCVEHPDLGRNPVLRAVALCLDLADEHVDGLPPMDESTRTTWLAVLEPIFNALDAGEERAPLEPDDAADAGFFFGAITEAFFLCSTELKEYEPALYALLATYYGQDPAARRA